MQKLNFRSETCGWMQPFSKWEVGWPNYISSSKDFIVAKIARIKSDLNDMDLFKHIDDMIHGLK